MSDTRTYIVPDGQENSTNQMLPWMAMMNGGMGGFGNGMWNNPFMYLVWMWMMRWMNRGEFGDGNSCQNLQSAEIQGQLAGLREQMNTNQNTQLLMDAIKGNSAALGQLATNLNCDFGVLKDCCCNIQNAIAQQEDKLVILLKELSTLQKEVTVMLFRQLITAAATHRKLLSNKATKINQQMKDRLIRLLIVQIQQDVQQKEVSAILLMQLRLRLALFKILLETQVLQTLIRLQLSLTQCRIRLCQIRLMLYVKRIVNRLLLLTMPNRLLHLDNDKSSYYSYCCCCKCSTR